MHYQTQCGCEPHSYGKGPSMAHGHSKWHGHHGYRGGGGMHHGSNCCSCGCHHGGMMNRHFTSKEELIAKLEEYLKQLQAEAKGAKERIAELKKES